MVKTAISPSMRLTLRPTFLVYAVGRGFLLLSGRINALARRCAPVHVPALFPRQSLFYSTTLPRLAGSGDEKKLIDISIPMERLEMHFSRSSGPGGQNVNKVNTKAEIRFVVREAEWIPEQVRARLLELHANRVNVDGELVITCQEHRCVLDLPSPDSAGLAERLPMKEPALIMSTPARLPATDPDLCSSSAALCCSPPPPASLATAGHNTAIATPVCKSSRTCWPRRLSL